MVKKIVCFFISVLIVQISFAQKITGNVSGFFNEPLGFASIVVKGTSIGVSANDSGKFSINLSPGNYVLECGHVGYATAEKRIHVTKNDMIVNFQLETILYHLKDVVVKSGGEDHAYEIIRNAIKKRPDYENELKSFQCQVYIKGQLKLNRYPRRFLGGPVTFDPGDTTQQKMIFLSETLANYYVHQPDSKTDVISTRVSGNQNGFGFSIPEMISFYHNNVTIGKNLNQRGFISPIADNAMNYYDYKFEGSFFDNGVMINRIHVKPRRKFEPLFEGFINIIEDSWRIYSLQLTLTKDNEMQYLDVLKIEQNYVPVGDTWVLKQEVVYPSFNILGFDGDGNFVQVYDKYNFHPSFSKNFFNSTIMKFEDTANKKLSSYWDSIRPVPLTTDEAFDYKRKDSLEILRKNPHSIDSMDDVKNKIHFWKLFLSGQTFYKTNKHFSFYEPAPVNVINYNTVEGFNLSYSPDIEKLFPNKQSISLTPNLRYGFSNKHFNAHITGLYDFDKKNVSHLYFSGGRDVFQFNNDQPVDIRSNTITGLLYRENYMKIYEAGYAKLAYTKGLSGGWLVTLSSEFQNRRPLDNTSTYSFFDFFNGDFTPNYPTDLTDHQMPKNKALSAKLSIDWNPGAKYVEYPDKKILVSSTSPMFNLTLTRGIPTLLGSNVDYSKWSLGVMDTIDLKHAGKFDYHVTLGGFFNARQTFIPDYNQYIGNRGTFASDYLNDYLLMFYYQFANTAPFYVSAHAEYHLNGLISNRIPLMRRYKWFFVAGGNTLNISNSQYYYEAFLSIENIYKIGRIDFVQAYLTPGIFTSGVRISVSGLLDGPQDK